MFKIITLVVNVIPFGSAWTHLHKKNPLVCILHFFLTELFPPLTWYFQLPHGLCPLDWLPRDTCQLHQALRPQHFKLLIFSCDCIMFKMLLYSPVAKSHFTHSNIALLYCGAKLSLDVYLRSNETTGSVMR